MFSHRPAATTSLDAAPARLRSPRFSLADNCRAGGPAALLSGEQSTQENVNWVYGLGENPQRILPAPLFVILLMLLFPLAVYLPTHLLFARIFRAAAA